MAGALEGTLELAVQYANDRVQFGRPLAKFQAIQHQLALLAEQVAAARVAADAACATLASGKGDPEIAVAGAKIRAGEAAGKGTDYAHQVHGAIGFTAEHRLHHLTRRLWSWRDEFGTETHWSMALGRRVAAPAPRACGRCSPARERHPENPRVSAALRDPLTDGRAPRDLGPLLRPRSVAVIGASDDTTGIRGRLMAQLLKGGFGARSCRSI